MGDQYPFREPPKPFPVALTSMERWAWTDADLKAIAVLLFNPENGTKTQVWGDFSSYERMVPALKYTHQIQSINGDKVTFNNKEPRQIVANDVMWAHYFGKFTNTQGTYEDWKKYCNDRKTPLPDPFDMWEFGFERSWFYMRLGQLRETGSKSKRWTIDPKHYGALPLDNSAWDGK
ncbi:hypothetical protein XANCAGTX0491_003371 [Xanthoria calcicola]